MIAHYNPETRQVTIYDRNQVAIGHCSETAGGWDWFRDPWNDGELSTEQMQFIEGKLATFNL